MKIKKKYNIMIFSPTTGKSFSFEISSVVIKVFFSIFLLIIILSGIMLYQYSDYYKSKNTLKKLETQNTYLKQKIEFFNKRITTLKNEVDRLNELGTKLRVMARLDIPENNEEGKGGPSFEEVKNFLSTEKFEDENIKKLHYTLDKLSFELKQEQKNITELFKYFKETNIKLSSTPSIWPANGWVSSGFGYRRDPFTGRRRFHEGIDITNRPGTPIIAPADGVVTFAGRNGGYGKVIYISHGYGISTRYGHLRKIYVKVGQHVQRGDIIGEIGNTGRSTGPHLHYEVRVNHKPVNPLNFILN